MKREDIKVALSTPDNIDKLLSSCGQAYAKIVSRDIPYNTIDILIEELNTSKEEK